MNSKGGIISHLAVCLGEIIVGILLFINPTAFTSGIIFCLGAVLVIAGIASTIKYFTTDAVSAVKEQSILKGLILIIVGCFCLFKLNWFIATFPVLTTLYGIAVLLLGVWKIQLSINMARLKWHRWGIQAIAAALTIIFAIIILLNPFKTAVILWRFAGVSLIVEAIADFISFIFNRHSYFE